MNDGRGHAASGSLVELGLSDLESRCYRALLADGPATGYELARRTGKPAANVYKAVASLAAKGAVATRAGRTRVFEPIPPSEFLGQLERKQTALLRRAKTELERLASTPEPSRLHAIESAEAAFERATTMLRGATSIAVLDAFPLVMERLAPEIRKLRKRGVTLYLQSYEPTDLPATSSVLTAEAPAVLKHWKGQQLNLVVDGREALLCLLTPGCDRVVQAFWTNAIYLACMHHAGFLREHAFHAAHAALDRKPAEVKRILEANPTFHGTRVPGQVALAAQLEAIDKERS